MSVKITGMDNVIARLRQSSITTIRNAVDQSEITSANLENYSKETAPWTDRTGNARASIYGYSEMDSSLITITHGIQVSYGVFLELCHGGKYRVIGPSVNKYRSIWVSQLSGILGK